MKRIGTAHLKFSGEHNERSEHKQLWDGLSAVVRIGNTLWVANDETTSLERLELKSTHEGDTFKYGEHEHFPLEDFLLLPMWPPDPRDTGEADLEGLDYADGYLWLAGSHSRKRDKDNIAIVQKEVNRYLLGRIPLKDKLKPMRDMEWKGKRLTAARLGGNEEGNDLTQALKSDEHLGSFLQIPGKDNGFDIEGLAVKHDSILIGLRGPVLRGWAVILQLRLEEKDGFLKLRPIGLDDQLYRKHFLQLGGLGIRDLCVQNDDLLILAGPTMDLDGPVTVFRWREGARPDAKSLVPREDLLSVMSIPYGEGEDHAEGMTLFSPDDSKPDSILVVYDSASDDRKKGDRTLEADIFALPEAETV